MELIEIPHFEVPWKFSDLGLDIIVIIWGSCQKFFTLLLNKKNMEIAKV
jgi:hypothetical protein